MNILRRNFPSLFQLLLMAVALLAILVGGSLLPKIQEIRRQYWLTDNEPLQNAPPELVLASTVLGGFRGLVIDYLWLRVIELRNQGSHYEIVQLYDWIGKLEPRIPDVWDYITHEMVFNISITMPTPEERWRWIFRGIEQLRDFGIHYNQSSPKLYEKLGWLFIFKLGMDAVDEYRFYYQKQWGEMLEEVLGDNPNLEELAKSPRQWELLLRVPGVNSLFQTLQQEDIDITRDFFKSATLPADKQEYVKQVLQQQTNAEAWQSIRSYLQAKRLREQFKLEPVQMQALSQTYGKLDFRLSSTHALYWAEEARRVFVLAQEKEPELKNSVLDRNIDRLKYVALKQNFDYGEVLGKSPLGFVCMPNFAVLDSLYRIFEDIQKNWGLEQGIVSQEVFLNEAIRQCYMYNRRQQALKYYYILAKKFPKPDYQQDLDSYVVQQIGNEVKYLGRRHLVENYMVGTLVRSYQALRMGVPQMFASLTRFSEVLYQVYVQRTGGISEDGNKFEQPRSLEHFHKAARKVFQDQLQREMGADAAKTLLESLTKQFPNIFG